MRASAGQEPQQPQRDEPQQLSRQRRARCVGAGQERQDGFQQLQLKRVQRRTARCRSAGAAAAAAEGAAALEGAAPGRGAGAAAIGAETTDGKRSVFIYDVVWWYSGIPTKSQWQSRVVRL